MNRHGEIYSLLGKKLATCLVKDISTNGARLEIRTGDKLPDCFRLDYGGEEQPKCSIRWRNGNEMGVQFLLKSPLRPRIMKDCIVKDSVSPAFAEFLAARR